MGQCCNAAPVDTNTDGSPKKKLTLDVFSKSTSNKKLKSDKHSPKHPHHPLPEHQSSGSQSTPKHHDKTIFGNNDPTHTHLNDNQYNNQYQNNDHDDDDDEEIDLSLFQEDVAEFIEFWHQHFATLSKESIHNALVRRVHNKVKGIYSLKYIH